MNELQSPLPSRHRLLLLSVLLPAFVAGSNQLLFLTVGNHRLPSAWLYPWMTFTTAILSWCVGRYLAPAWLRWLVFIWCLALLDILTIAACLGGPVPSHVGYVLVSAQITFITVWAILGPWGWQWRLPMVLVAAAAVIVQSGSFINDWNAGSWNVFMIMTTFVVVVLCLGLRMFGFQLRRPLPAGADLNAADVIQANQFGMKHMLIWATAIVPILLVVRGFDGFILYALGRGGTFPAVLLAICLATINLIALWAVLGGGRPIIRLVVFLSVPMLIAVGITFYSAYLDSLYNRPARMGPPIIFALIEMHHLWISWLGLDAALSAALLLFVRASGYRLSRSEM